MARSFDYAFKLLVIGDMSVGKTCLLVRFCDDAFSTSYISTIGVDFKVRTIDIDGKRVKLQIWDTAGQDRFECITTAYYRGALGVLLVYDVTERKTYRNIKKWIDLLAQHGSEDVERILIGNKCDMEDKRQVTREAGEELGREYGITFMETSAKQNTNVEQAFFTLARVIKEKHDRKNINVNPQPPDNEQDKIVKPAPGPKPPTKSTCC